MKLAGFVDHVRDSTKMISLEFKNHRRRRTDALKKRRKNLTFVSWSKNSLRNKNLKLFLMIRNRKI
jgi:hypothetical protein